MATNTYVALDKKTATSDVASIEFTNIAQGYTDLVLIVSMQSSYTGDTGNGARLQFNGDTGNNYSNTNIRGNGTTPSSYRVSNSPYIQTGLLPSSGGGTPTNAFGAGIINIQNYSNTTTNKTVLSKTNSVYAATEASSGLWRSTSAITSIKYFGDGNILAGSTFSLYGIAAEGTSPAPKATGGAIYSDSTYYYHAFGASGTFTPLQSLSADILVVAGGGGNGRYAGGGGGGGGVITFTNQSLTATGYTCTVGAGGAASPSDGGDSSNGGNSSFGALTVAVGGGGGGGNSSSSIAGHAGGSGGGGGGAGGTAGGATTQTGTGATNYYGNAGGQAVGYAGAGGGGAGAAAGTAAVNTNNSGNGGVGISSSFINAIGTATGAGELSSGSYYFAAGGYGFVGGSATIGTGGIGGGGGGPSKPDTQFAANGRVNTGGGGGTSGTGTYFGAGGSGLVIVRYLR